MSEPFLAATGADSSHLYSIEEQESFMAHLIDHNNDDKVSAITNMLD